ncbi:MAG TPA: hypothetical protein VG518_04690 [Solirubrobacterales bacterium]|nr:hypothetical protein [Solirubrobacterales bacterium]
MATDSPRKVVRSYRLVFRRRWRLFRIQNWRIPLPGGLELRALGYWLACLGTMAVAGRLPLLGSLVATMPPSLRLLAVPVIAAWGLSRLEVDGRSPHRALFGLSGWWLRPRVIAGLRRCPPEQKRMAPLEMVVSRPDLRGASYPSGRLVGPAKVLLRYPIQVEAEGIPRGAGRSPKERLGAARLWRVRGAGGGAWQRGKTLEIPAGRTVVFEGQRR